MDHRAEHEPECAQHAVGSLLSSGPHLPGRRRRPVGQPRPHARRRLERASVVDVGERQPQLEGRPQRCLVLVALRLQARGLRGRRRQHLRLAHRVGCVIDVHSPRTAHARRSRGLSRGVPREGHGVPRAASRTARCGKPCGQQAALGRESHVPILTHPSPPRARATRPIAPSTYALCSPQHAATGLSNASINASKTLLVTHGYSQKCHVILTAGQSALYER